MPRSRPFGRAAYSLAVAAVTLPMLGCGNGVGDRGGARRRPGSDSRPGASEPG